MSTIFCSMNYAKKVVEMKGLGMATMIKNLVLINEASLPTELTEKALAQGITVRTF